VGILSWLVFGLLAGAVARLLTPGRQALGCLGTLALGLVGALIGGLIGEAVLRQDVHYGWHLGPFLLSVAGAVVLLLAANVLARQ